jgi:hypothetical protein
MKLAVLSESEADEAALRIIAEGILGRQVEWHRGFRRRSSGFGSVPGLLRPALMELHYHTDVDGLLVVVDSDHTPLSFTRARTRVYRPKVPALHIERHRQRLLVKNWIKAKRDKS